MKVLITVYDLLPLQLQKQEERRRLLFLKNTVIGTPDFLRIIASAVFMWNELTAIKTSK